MERLTEHHVNKTMGVYMVCSGACDDFNCTDCGKLDEIVARLAAYEDTGLSPETVSDLLERLTYFYRTVEGLDLVDPVHFGAFVDRVKRWQQAEQDGRLVVLPVKEGSTIYRVRLNLEGDHYEIIEIDFNLARFHPEDFGRIVFKTREEAEEALKKREVTNETD